MKIFTVPLQCLAHGRTGDKGDRSNISVIAWHPALYGVIVEQLTEAAVMRQFAHRRPTQVTRYLLPKLHAMNFVLDEDLDSHGKALSFLLLDIPIELPAALWPLLKNPPAGLDTLITSTGDKP
jgi:hypothetical protein